MIKAMAQFFQLNGIAVQFIFLIKVKANKRILAWRRFKFFNFNFIDFLGTAGGLFRFRGIGREAAHEVL